jgi:GMP synthase-like glutamine amidotransferase
VKVAILKTGAPPPELEARFGGYPEMIMEMIGDGYHTYEVFDVRTGPLPTQGWHHGVIITGSPSGVYDGDPWIRDLKMWLHGALGRCKMVGICFGHQIMGEAFGGDVKKSDKGWGIGLHEHRVERPYPWMDPPAASLRLPVSHQDQVVYRGVSSHVLLTSPFCGYAGLEHGADAISFQGHPEFTPEFAKALIEARRGTRYHDAFADAAIASLDRPNDRDIAAQWIRNFLLEPIKGEGRIGPATIAASETT